jgi:hypothetical protein
MNDDELTDEEREWLGRVPEGVEPPPELRDRVVERLARAGEIAVRAPRPRGPGLAVAAGVLLAFAAGGIAGRMTAPEPRSAGDPAPAAPGPSRAASPVAGDYVLLLYEDGGYEAPGRSMAELVAEYSAWAERLAESGLLVAAEKLSDEGRIVPGIGPGGAGAGDPIPATSPLLGGALGTLTGYFIVRAEDWAEAAHIARESPHAAYGGRVAIRRIDPT